MWEAEGGPAVGGGEGLSDLTVRISRAFFKGQQNENATAQSHCLGT